MTINDLLAEAKKLEEMIAQAQGDARHDLHRQLHGTIEAIRLKGGSVPSHLRTLDLDLVDEEVEETFDNMPV